MKIVAFCALHYGKPYLRWALRSVVDYVDECWVLYTATPSYGYRTTTHVCPDTRDELIREAQKGAGAKLRWVDVGPFPNEGAHRNEIYRACPDADVIVVVDSDEIWPTSVVKMFGTASDTERRVRYWRVPMIHYWRSFSHCVLDDLAYPIRIIHPKASGGDGTIETPSRINHMGYAIPPALVEYKWKIHGHLAEYRKDINWLRDRYLANAQQDCHPVSVGYWNPVEVDPLKYMPAFMADHPYYGEEIIE